MKNLIQFCAVLLLAAPSFAGDFIVGATEKGVNAIYVKPVGAADGCHVVTAAEVITDSVVIPKTSVEKERVCRANGFETVTIVIDGKETQMERPLPYTCSFCDRDADGKAINCTPSNSVKVQEPDVLVLSNDILLNIEPAQDLVCAGITSGYIKLPVTPGQSMTITMPEEVQLLDMKPALTESDSVLENVIYTDKK